jgi:hypothetical protein
MGRSRTSPNVRSLEAAGVRYLGIYRLADHVGVGSYVHNTPSEEELREKIGQVLAANAAQVHPRLSIPVNDVGTIHYETDRYAMFVAVTAPSYPQRTVFRCLRELRERFDEELLHKAEPGGLSKALRPLMAELCTKYADAAAIDKTLNVMTQVDDVKGIVGESIQHLLATHENLEVLEDRSEALREQASTFHKKARATKNQTRAMNTRLRR